MTIPTPPASQQQPVPGYGQQPAAPGYGQQPYAPGYATAPPATSDRSFIATWLLSMLVGWLGVDRFYLGKIGTGIVKLITIGGLGVWWLIDLILVLAGAQRDKQGRTLNGYDQHKKVAWIVSAVFIVLSMILGAVNGANAAGSTSETSVEQPASAEDDPAEQAAEEAPAEEAPAEEAPAEPTAADWANETYGTFETVKASGSGDDIVTLPTATAGLVTASFSGSGHFIVNVIDANNGATGDLLVNTIGAYNGVSAYGFNALSQGVSLQVTANGPWTISVSPVSSAPEIAASGSGDAVFIYDGDASKLAAANTGEGNFIVTEETNEALDFGLLINEIGAYSGTVPLSAGPSVITVKSSGDWTLAVG